MSDNLALFWSTCRANLYGNEVHCHNWFCYTCCLHSKYVSMSRICCWASVLALPRRFSLTILEERSQRFLSRDFPESNALAVESSIPDLLDDFCHCRKIDPVEILPCPESMLSGSFHSQ